MNLRIFFENYRSGEGVSHDAPLEADFESTRIHLNKLRGEGCFLGVIAEQRTTYQFLLESDGRIWFEILNTDTRFAEGCHISLPIAEKILEWVFNVSGSVEIKSKLECEFLLSLTRSL